MNSTTLAPVYTLSIISHGQGDLIKNLLIDLSNIDPYIFRVIITLNIPEDESYLSSLPKNAIIIRNKSPIGFGANHNQAFLHANTKFFVIINPDIRFNPNILCTLSSILISSPNNAAIGPKVFSSSNHIQDSARYFPTLLIIFKRSMLRLLGIGIVNDYVSKKNEVIEVDWVAGMFILFDSVCFKSIGGFNEKYFMYLEDADICRRLKSLGLRTLYYPQVSVIHDAQRKSRMNRQHFLWHIRSLFRFITNL